MPARRVRVAFVCRRERGVETRPVPNPDVSILDPSPDPVVHPEDREERDESGPWLAILVGATLAWLPLAALDWRLLVEGTFVWATVRSVSTLLLAPLAAAALVQDARALDADGVEVGWPTWVYALVALVFPPVSAAYLGHRYVLVRDGDDATDREAADATDRTATGSAPAVDDRDDRDDTPAVDGTGERDDRDPDRPTD
jgi:hypothetical protein